MSPAGGISGARLVAEYEPGSPQWHEARHNAMTGSRIAAVLGLSPWESRFSLWHRMAGTIGEKPSNPNMSWGTILEPVIRQQFAKQHQDEADVIETGTWENIDRPWQRVNPDGLIYPNDGGKPEVLEIKCSRNGAGWGEPGSDDIPVYYRCQVLWALDVLDLQRAHIAVLISGYDYREYTIERHEEDCDLMRKEGHAFLQTLTSGQAPDIDDGNETYNIIKSFHPLIDDEDREIPAEIAEPYIESYNAKLIGDKNLTMATAHLAAYMQTARRGTYQGQSIAIRIPGRNGNPPYIKRTI